MKKFIILLLIFSFSFSASAALYRVNSWLGTYTTSSPPYCGVNIGDIVDITKACNGFNWENGSKSYTANSGGLTSGNQWYASGGGKNFRVANVSLADSCPSGQELNDIGRCVPQDEGFCESDEYNDQLFQAEQNCAAENPDHFAYIVPSCTDANNYNFDCKQGPPRPDPDAGDGDSGSGDGDSGSGDGDSGSGDGSSGDGSSGGGSSGGGSSGGGSSGGDSDDDSDDETNVTPTACSSGVFTCSGNAYECFMAEQAFLTRCSSDLTTDEASLVSDLNGYGDDLLEGLEEFKNSVDVDELFEESIALDDTLTTFTESNGGLNFTEGCPSPVFVDYGIGNFTLSYEPFCELALYVRAMIMLTASIGSILMIAKFS